MLRKKPNFFYCNDKISTLLIPLSWLYYICFLFLRKCFFKKKRICNKTVCVGNIVVGGSGKTPICITLQNELSKYYDKICFVTKGYCRKSKSDIVIPRQHGLLFNINEVGDEPLLLSEYADVFVIKKRNKAKCEDYDLAICDDGFFDNSIHKDCQIVVFDCNFFIGNGKVLPAGPLRSKLDFLKKADFVILTDINDNVNDNIDLLSNYIQKDRILQAELIVKSNHDKNKKYFAFSGIGENKKFFNSLAKYGIQLVDFLSFEDHKEYEEEDLEKIIKTFKNSLADCIITTSKDYLKLPNDFCVKNNVEVFEISYEIKDVDKIISFLIKD